MDLAQLVVQVKQKQAAKSLDNIQNKLQDVGKTAENIGKTLLAGWSFTKILDSFKSFSNMMNDVNTQARNFKAIFGDSLDYANSQVQNLIKNFDETERSAQRLMSQIGSKIIQIGFSPLDATKITSQFAVISEQISAATGKPLEEVAKKLTNALTGETGGLREIGMVINTNTDSFKQQVRLLMETKDLTAEQAKKQAILNTVMKQSQKYTGAFKETANTISHQLDNIKNTFKSGIGAQIGSILNKLLVPVLKYVDKVLSLPIIKHIGAVSGAVTILIGMFSSIWIILKKIFGFGWGKLVSYWHSIVTLGYDYQKTIKSCGSDIKKNNEILREQIKLQKELVFQQNLKARMANDKQFIDPQKLAQVSEKLEVAAKLQTEQRRNQTIGDILGKLETEPVKTKNGMAFNKVLSDPEAQFTKARDLMQKFEYILVTSSSTLLQKMGLTLTPVFQTLMNKLAMDTIYLGSSISKNIIKAFEIGDLIYKSMNKIKTAFIAGFDLITKGVSNYIAKSTFANAVVDKAGKKVDGFIGGLAGSVLGKLKWVGLGLMKVIGWVVTGLTALAGALFGLTKVIALPIVAIVAVAAFAYQVGQWISNMIIQWKLMKPSQTDTSLNKWRTSQKHDELDSWSQ